ncbi:MAG: hypothetical protein H7296_13130 [Bacteroidia bacterium]|nr:hypothetical protein [Bacteroidia bacterium]
MKNSFLNAISIAGILIFLLINNSCKNPVEGLSVTLNTNLTQSNYGVKVANGNPDINEIPQSLKIKIVGTGANYIFNSDGTKNFTAENGIFSLILSPGIKPTSDNPIRFTILIESDGYLKSVYPIEINDEGNKIFDINMVKLSSPPKGVSLKEDIVYLPSNGELPAAKIITIPLSSGKQETAKIEMEEGTKMFDENGTVITGNVTVSMVHFDNRSYESLNSFPGGFTATNLIDEKGLAMEPVVFESAGFMSVEISNGSQSVKSFSKPVNITMEINEATVNPETGNVVKEGDSIPSWSLDTKTGQWKKEAIAIFGRNATTNKLEAVMSVPHLSWWNLDYYYSSCVVGSTITLRTNLTTPAYRYMELVNADNSIFRNTTESVTNGNVIRFYRAPINKRVKLKVYSGINYYNKGTLIAETPIFLMCGNNINLNLILPLPTIFNVDIAGNCEVGGRKLLPSIWIYYREKNSYYWNVLGFMNNGKISTDRFVLGRSYIFATFYSGRWYEYERIIDKTNYKEIMSLPFGTAGCR